MKPLVEIWAAHHEQHESVFVHVSGGGKILVVDSDSACGACHLDCCQVIEAWC